MISPPEYLQKAVIVGGYIKSNAIQINYCFNRAIIINQRSFPYSYHLQQYPQTRANDQFIRSAWANDIENPNLRHLLQTIVTDLQFTATLQVGHELLRFSQVLKHFTWNICPHYSIVLPVSRQMVHQSPNREDQMSCHSISPVKFDYERPSTPNTGSLKICSLPLHFLQPHTTAIIMMTKIANGTIKQAKLIANPFYYYLLRQVELQRQQSSRQAVHTKPWHSEQLSPQLKHILFYKQYPNGQKIAQELFCITQEQAHYKQTSALMQETHLSSHLKHCWPMRQQPFKHYQQIYMLHFLQSAEHAWHQRDKQSQQQPSEHIVQVVELVQFAQFLEQLLQRFSERQQDKLHESHIVQLQEEHELMMHGLQDPSVRQQPSLHFMHRLPLVQSQQLDGHFMHHNRIELQQQPSKHEVQSQTWEHVMHIEQQSSHFAEWRQYPVKHLVHQDRLLEHAQHPPKFYVQHWLKVDSRRKRRIILILLAIPVFEKNVYRRQANTLDANYSYCKNIDNLMIFESYATITNLFNGCN